MPRPRRCRRIWQAPDEKAFKPVGKRLRELAMTSLSFDEFEAVRLKDHENLEQKDAADKMDISQPTFHRLLNTARKKIADALVNSKSLRIAGGNIRYSEEKTDQSFGKGRRRGHGRGLGK